MKLYLVETDVIEGHLIAVATDAGLANRLGHEHDAKSEEELDCCYHRDGFTVTEIEADAAIVHTWQEVSSVESGG